MQAPAPGKKALGATLLSEAALRHFRHQATRASEQQQQPVFSYSRPDSVAAAADSLRHFMGTVAPSGGTFGQQAAGGGGRESGEGPNAEFVQLLTNASYTELVKLRHDLTTLQAQAGQLQHDNDQLRLDVGQLREAVAADVGGLRKDVAVVGDGVGSVQKDVGGLRKDVAVVGDDVGSVQKDVGGLRKDVAVVGDDVGSVQKDVAKVTTDVTSLQQSVSSDIGSLQADLAAVQRDIAQSQQSQSQTDTLVAELKAQMGESVCSCGTFITFKTTVIMNQNTQEVKNQRFLISTRQNNVGIFGIRF